MKSFLLLISCIAVNSFAQSEGPYRESKAQGYLAKPAQVQFSPELLKMVSRSSLRNS